MAGPVPWKKPSILTNSANEQCSGVPGVLLTKEFATSILRGLNLFPGEPHGLGPILLQTEGTRPLLASQSPPLLKYLCLFSASSQPNSYTLQSSCVYVRMHACMHVCMCVYVCLSVCTFFPREDFWFCRVCKAVLACRMAPAGARSSSRCSPQCRLVPRALHQWCCLMAGWPQWP